ncbi:tRNA(Ile)-lysidine synthase [tilS] [Acididesulfobacillus acetoxydans]|uniref:tRNA(Ile)-lysidine synthase n=1 Tax=Acididesulfobacillus acetoxydans TaxID=1561005 RepID=A0A8S0W1U3_9FIRM|nr:tRNA lysidine(34) synthetase TilS [Acididesulfobacillus acetoxydans]CAA7599908.1 tRNA(Ile)-lysidine synthase [tilS] [Acididesulfobacillus acetoxydans]CEJ08948.1 tRNA(Ile)-lysidine synthase [Acididesulfobacillus acetoxydans]
MYRRLRAQVLPELIPARSRILVAISGGPDSVALSHILWRYSREAKEREITLVLSHVNHRARPEAEDEARMVVRLGREWGIPCLVHEFKAKDYAKEIGLSFQEAARNWRYARWQEDMRREGCQLLATAHHLNDQAETILYRLLRGSGSAGLAGIYPQRNGVIRPLLSVRKEEILAYCREENLPYALDRSNEEPVYARNRIRLELIPLLLERYNPRLLEVLGRTGDLMRWDEEYLAAAAAAEWEKYVREESSEGVCLSPEVFGLAPALFSRLLRRAAAVAGGEPRGLGYVYVEQIRQSRGISGWRQDLPGIVVSIDEKGLWLLPRAAAAGKNRPGISESEECPGTAGETEIFRQVPWDRFTVCGKTGLEVGLFRDCEDGGANGKYPAGNGERGKGAAILVLDSASLRGAREPLVVRTRRPGDKMWFRGVGHKSLKKICQEAGIPSGQREKMLLLASGNEVIWLPPLRKSDLFAPREGGRNVCCILRPTKDPSPEIP